MNEVKTITIDYDENTPWIHKQIILDNGKKTKKIDGIEYCTLFSDNPIRFNNINNTSRNLSLTDIENFENGNIVQIDRNYYYLLGDKLYSLNNRKMIDADWKLYKKAKVVSLIDYINDREYIEIERNTINIEDNVNNLMYNCFFKGYEKVIINDALNFLDFDNSNNIYLTNDIKNLMHAHYNFDSIIQRKTIAKPSNIYKLEDNIITYCDTDYCWVKKDINDNNEEENHIIPLSSVLVQMEKELIRRNNNKYPEFFVQETCQNSDKKIKETKDYYYEKFPFNDVLKNILESDKVENQLNSGFWVLKEFIYNYGQNGKDRKNYYNKRVHGNDYTFLIINFIKAAEILLYNKLKTLKNNKLSPNSALEAMLKIIENNKNKYIKDCFNITQKDNFIKSYKDIKKIARNGNFHKQSIESFEKAEEIIQNTIQFLIRIEIYIK